MFLHAAYGYSNRLFLIECQEFWQSCVCTCVVGYIEVVWWLGGLAAAGTLTLIGHPVIWGNPAVMRLWTLCCFPLRFSSHLEGKQTWNKLTWTSWWTFIIEEPPYFYCIHVTPDAWHYSSSTIHLEWTVYIITCNNLAQYLKPSPSNDINFCRVNFLKQRCSALSLFS